MSVSDSLYSDSPHTDFSHVYYILSIFNPRVLFPFPRPLSFCNVHYSVVVRLVSLRFSFSRKTVRTVGVPAEI